MVYLKFTPLPFRNVRILSKNIMVAMYIYIYVHIILVTNFFLAFYGIFWNN